MKERQALMSTNLKMTLPQHFLRQMEDQKIELMKIREQQQTILSIDENLRKKSQQILRLKTLADKFQPYYKKYNELSHDYTQKCGRLNQKQKQFNMLLKQVEELSRQNDTIHSKLQTCEQQRAKLLKEQHQIQKVNQQIEQTFKLYQQQCKKKQMGLLKDLQKAYKQVTQLSKRIDEYEMKVFENQELKQKLRAKTSQQDIYRNKLQQYSSLYNNLDMVSNYPTNNKHFQELKQQNQNLKLILSNKQDELTKYKILNQELSIQFDKSVNKICQFERQLTKYRHDNHELQKMLNLFVEKEKYEKMHMRQLEKINTKNQRIQSAHQRGGRTSQQNQRSEQNHMPGQNNSRINSKASNFNGEHE